MFSELVDWICESDGGEVHSSLRLGEGTASRGIVAVGKIRKGELLLSLPMDLAIRGESLPKTYHNGKNTSSWLRCLAALYQAHKQTRFRPYLNSLPDSFDTLLAWETDELENYLGGTSLGALVLEDRKGKVPETRYREAVRPYLEHLHLLPSTEEEEQAVFQRACMCISTRGFHLNQIKGYSWPSHPHPHDEEGPFLLPLIDLLNHNPDAKCTTLHLDAQKKTFCMIAERDVEEGEEVFHSYGDHLTSGQLLQTFGFVSDKAIEVAKTNTKGLIGNQSTTPAVLSKKSIVRAVQDVIQSEYPSELRDSVDSRQEGCETWDLDFDISIRNVDAISDDLVVTPTNPLSDEITTLCCSLLVPDVAYEELSGDQCLLDKSVLEDYFLGKLVCKALLGAISDRLEAYGEIRVPGLEKTSSDESVVLKLLPKSLHHAAYGLTLRSEEKACLEALRNKLDGILRSLDPSGAREPDGAKPLKRQRC